VSTLSYTNMLQENSDLSLNITFFTYISHPPLPMFSYTSIVIVLCLYYTTIQCSHQYSVLTSYGIFGHVRQYYRAQAALEC
jgi:hypothetical protein